MKPFKTLLIALFVPAFSFAGDPLTTASKSAPTTEPEKPPTHQVEVIRGIRRDVSKPGDDYVSFHCDGKITIACIVRLIIKEQAPPTTEGCKPIQRLDAIPFNWGTFQPNKNYVGFPMTEGGMHFYEVRSSAVRSCDEGGVIIEIDTDATIVETGN